MELWTLIALILIGGLFVAAALVRSPDVPLVAGQPWAARPVMDTALLMCARCFRAFEPDDAVVLVVPFAERGPVVRMGDELLFHEACAALPAGLREVGRGTHRDIIDGLRRAYHPNVVDSEPV